MLQETEVEIGEDTYMVLSNFKTIKRIENATNERCIPLGRRFDTGEWGLQDVFTILHAATRGCENPPKREAIEEAIEVRGAAIYAAICGQIILKGVMGQKIVGAAEDPGGKKEAPVGGNPTP